MHNCLGYFLHSASLFQLALVQFSCLRCFRTMGLAQLKQLAGETGFNGRDDARAEHAAMSTYPDAAILLCSFHVQQAVWRWLWKGNNKVLLRDRNGCMDLFHRLPYSETEGDYLEMEDMMTRGNNTNNFVEAAFRLLKDGVLHRARAFNCVHSTEYLITKFELSICNRLLDIAHGRTELRHRRKRPATSSAVIKHKVGDQYEVVIGKTERLVQADLSLCSCTYGNIGNLCKHLWAVMESAFEHGTNEHRDKLLQHQREDLF
ncbi:uncharacterized protein [Watersipora subatra]|uniref:uncharacterized protein isoform X2 n=1 Tax=Watersipora subatra TaxID=2589382 RepID=UPI00355AD3F5